MSCFGLVVVFLFWSTGFLLLIVGKSVSLYIFRRWLSWHIRNVSLNFHEEWEHLRKSDRIRPRGKMFRTEGTAVTWHSNTETPFCCEAPSELVARVVIYIREVPGSDLGRSIYYSDWGFSWFSSVPPSESWDSTIKVYATVSSPILWSSLSEIVFL
jgi:hypothetical protein